MGTVRRWLGVHVWDILVVIVLAGIVVAVWSTPEEQSPAVIFAGCALTAIIYFQGRSAARRQVESTRALSAPRLALQALEGARSADPPSTNRCTIENITGNAARDVRATFVCFSNNGAQPGSDYLWNPDYELSVRATTCDVVPNTLQAHELGEVMSYPFLAVKPAVAEHYGLRTYLVLHCVDMDGAPHCDVETVEFSYSKGRWTMVKGQVPMLINVRKTLGGGTDGEGIDNFLPRLRHATEREPD